MFVVLHVDVQGFNNSIPLSPQWLQTKPGENKSGLSTGVCYPAIHDYLFIFYIK